jgi:hypothetical protein
MWPETGEGGGGLGRTVGEERRVEPSRGGVVAVHLEVDLRGPQWRGNGRQVSQPQKGACLRTMLRREYANNQPAGDGRRTPQRAIGTAGVPCATVSGGTPHHCGRPHRCNGTQGCPRGMREGSAAHSRARRRYACARRSTRVCHASTARSVVRAPQYATQNKYSSTLGCMGPTRTVSGTVPSKYPSSLRRPSGAPPRSALLCSGAHRL